MAVASSEGTRDPQSFFDAFTTGFNVGAGLSSLGFGNADALVGGADLVSPVLADADAVGTASR